MSSHRWLTRLTVRVIIGAALTAGTAVASADANDDAYLSKLKNLGIAWQPGSESDLIALGHAVCSDRMAGKTPDAIASDLHSGMSAKGFSYSDMTAWVSASESVYCPG